MGLVKRTYVDGETVITAENLNAIQDAIIENEEDIATKGTYSKPSGGIPKTDLASSVQDSLDAADTALQSSDIDNTLSVTGKAADAKKTGDEIGDLKNILNYRNEYENSINKPIVTNFVIGVYTTNGILVERYNYGISSPLSEKLSFADNIVLLCEEGFAYAIQYYTSDGTFIRTDRWHTDSVTIPADSIFTISIRPDPYDPSVPADIESYREKVRIQSEVGRIQSEVGRIQSEVESIQSEVESIQSEVDEAYYANALQDIAGVSKFPGNLAVAKECVDGVYIDYRNGEEKLSTSYFATGFLPVVEGEAYRANVGRNYAWYNENKVYISGTKGTGIQSSDVAPIGAAYIRITINKVDDNMTDPRLFYFADIDEYSLDVIIPGLVYRSWCYGKKINWIGDSIIDGRDFDEEVCEALGLVKDSEYGINGSTIALKDNGTDGRHALCERYINMSDDADIIAVSCGTNDFEYAWSPIGTIESTEKTTFYGALKTLCEGLINKYPRKVIFFTTPIKRAQPFESGAGGEYTEDGIMTTPFSKNKYGKTLSEYADIIKEVCGYYSIPVLDMYRESLLNPHIASQQDMFDSLYTHPNTVGQKIMARRVAGWINQLGYTIPNLT